MRSTQNRNTRRPSSAPPPRRLLPLFTEKTFSRISIGVIALITAYVLFEFFHDLMGPDILVSQAEHIAVDRPPHLELKDRSGIRAYEISVIQKGKETFRAKKLYRNPEERVVVQLPSAAISHGKATVLVRASDGSAGNFGAGNTRSVELPIDIDQEAPGIQLLSRSALRIRQGGTGMLQYRVSEPCRKTGVIAGDRWHPATQLHDGSWICFFAFPYAAEVKAFTVAVSATDMAGNTGERRVAALRYARTFKADTIPLSEKFLQQAEAKLLELAPDCKGSLLERYLFVNRTVRAANVRQLEAIGRRSDSVKYWEGPFLRMPRSAARAGFGERRTYLFSGKAVDEQRHLGQDLASTRQAAVPAANAGRVAFVGELGIYGRTAVIDHGLGIMTLYAHLSSCTVREGDMVKRGEAIGKTGTSGLVFGDHLHFGVLVHGVEVAPQEWLDPAWIRDNVETRIVVPEQREM
ncbi:MAG: M23 family metallopeptidase [Desulfovibrionaceae bacterium]|nr:M23 family metallopeptidase [Desulfovibrionaceae bacterium]